MRSTPYQKNMTGLMLHCGANRVEYGEVQETVTPEATRTHTPIPHSHLVDLVHDGLGRAGVRILEESHALTHDANRYFGLFRVGTGSDESGKDYGAVMGLRNSHDKTFPSALAFGANVFVCDNLSFMGEVKFGRKHTTHILRDLPKVVSRTIGKLGDAWGLQEKRFDAYRDRELSRSEAHDDIIEAFRAGACTSTQIKKVVDQWHAPNHHEFKPRNSWSLFNAFTEVLKGNLNELPKRTQALHGFMDGRCGLKLELNRPADVVVTA